jgi:hypothetical protein
MERDDLTAPVVPGGDEFSLGYRAVSEERLGHWDRPPDHGAPACVSAVWTLECT